MNHPRLRPIALPLLTIVVAVAGHADPAPDVAEIQRNLLPYTLIEGQPGFVLQDRMDHYAVPGVSIAVIEDFEIRTVAHFGTRRVGGDEPVGPQTLFNVGSLSKAVTSACILTLVDRGEIELDGDVNTQLTSWQVPANEFTAAAPVTPRLLMNHSAGLPHRAPFAFTADQMPTPLQLVRGEPPSRLGPLEVFQVPGAGFQYSNGGFTVLQILAEDVTGLPFDQAVARYVFDPLDLRFATFATPLPTAAQATAATGHQRNGLPLAGEPVWLPHTAAGGLWITAEDYARFVRELQLSAQGRSNRLFSRELAADMLSPQAASQYGMGVFLYEGSGEEPYFSHIGDSPGFVGGFAAHRTAGCGAVVLTNGSGGINLCREIIRSVAAVHDWPGFLPTPRPALPVTAADLARIEGRYRLDLDGVVTVALDGDRLVLTGEDWPGLQLFKVAADSFVCRERKGWLAAGTDPGTSRPYLDCAFSDDMGRPTGFPRRADRMEPGQSTPLELLLAGASEAAIREYVALQAADPGHARLAEPRFNRLGYALLADGDTAAAVAVFQLNTVLYPESANAFDSYGEGLLAAGDREGALANYRRSLDLDPGNANAARVLAELTGEPGRS